MRIVKSQRKWGATAGPGADLGQEEERAAQADLWNGTLGSAGHTWCPRWTDESGEATLALKGPPSLLLRNARFCGPRSGNLNCHPHHVEGKC